LHPGQSFPAIEQAEIAAVDPIGFTGALQA
jgi:hypothetical protein